VRLPDRGLTNFLSDFRLLWFLHFVSGRRGRSSRGYSGVRFVPVQ